MKLLLAVSAWLELGAGVALLGVPSLVVGHLLGGALEGPAAIRVTRLGGVALIALGAACWLVRREAPGRAARAVIAAMLIYNVGAVVILGAAGAATSWVLPWAGAFLHTVMALWCAAHLRELPR